jgi:hypothetical protein
MIASGDPGNAAFDAAFEKHIAPHTDKYFSGGIGHECRWQSRAESADFDRQPRIPTAGQAFRCAIAICYWSDAFSALVSKARFSWLN